jgi:hypothetical protein
VNDRSRAIVARTVTRERSTADSLQEVASVTEKTIQSAAPRLTRVIKYDAPTYQGRGDVCTIGIWKRFVAVGFWAGAKLAIRHTILEGTAPSSRVVKLRTAAEARSPALKALIRDAVRLDASDPVHPR